MHYKTGYSLNAKMKDLILSVGRPGTKFPHCQDQGPCPLIVKAKDYVLSMSKPMSTHVPSMSRPRTMPSQCQSQGQHVPSMSKPRTMSPQCQGGGPQLVQPLEISCGVELELHCFIVFVGQLYSAREVTRSYLRHSTN